MAESDVQSEAAIYRRGGAPACSAHATTSGVQVPSAQA